MEGRTSSVLELREHSWTTQGQAHVELEKVSSSSIPSGDLLPSQRTQFSGRCGPGRWSTDQGFFKGVHRVLEKFYRGSGQRDAE